MSGRCSAEDSANGCWKRLDAGLCSLFSFFLFYFSFPQSTSNYLARTFGVRSAMPGFIAKKLCPGLVVVPCRFSKYKQESAVIRRIFEHYDKEFSMGSLDEASLDLTDYMTRRNAPGKNAFADHQLFLFSFLPFSPLYASSLCWPVRLSPAID